MFKWLKKDLIPYEGNDHQPHFLRNESVRMVVIFILIIEISLFVLPFASVYNLSRNFSASVISAVLDNLTNQNRQNQYLAVLKVNPVLNQVAELKAKDMAEKDYFAHTSPEGLTPWYWFNMAGYKYEYAGENLAIDFTDSQDVVNAWMNSPTHKANIIKGAYTEIGTGIATGTYEGRQTIFVAQVYAKPASVVTVIEPIKVEEEVVPMAKVSSSSTGIAPMVLGSSTNVVEDDKSISQVDNTQSEPVVTKSVETNPVTNAVAKYLTSPRHILNIILIILGILIALTIIFKLVHKVDKKHPRLITNGLIVLVLIFGLYVANNLIAKNKATTTTSFFGFDSQNEEVK